MTVTGVNYGPINTDSQAHPYNFGLKPSESPFLATHVSPAWLGLRGSYDPPTRTPLGLGPGRSAKCHNPVIFVQLIQHPQNPILENPKTTSRAPIRLVTVQLSKKALIRTSLIYPKSKSDKIWPTKHPPRANPANQTPFRNKVFIKNPLKIWP